MVGELFFPGQWDSFRGFPVLCVSKVVERIFMFLPVFTGFTGLEITFSKSVLKF